MTKPDLLSQPFCCYPSPLIMTYLALATDYDGTIADEGAVDAATVSALQRWREAGRRLILVTGRMLDDWLAVFPQYAPLELFDWVVTENGAVLYHPPSQTVKLLVDPPPAEFGQRLRQQVGDGSKVFQAAGGSGEFAKLIQSGKLDAFASGRVIVSTWQPYDAEATALIQELRLDLQVILNKRAVMILPNGIDKAFGLQAALQELNLTPAQTVGVGDAENDLHMLRFCGLAAAVANALPAVKAEADWVAASARGAGVVELINHLLAQAAL